ncbi:MAG: hypothetical protein IIZ78_25190 [Clostridiales bacterium]|jgi:hypothetical protein|nr:hypothetical protein [Clostridiales bacterium]
MDVKTRSGFECKVNERKLKDWRFAKALAKCDSGDESKVLDGLTFVVPFLLGEDGEESLMKHVEDADGIVSTESVISEIRNIIELVGEEVKKSQSSQA